MITSILKAVVAIFMLYFVYSIVSFYYPWKKKSYDWKNSKPPYPSAQFDNIFWFVQISDIHISIFLDSNRGPDLEEFCKVSLNAIKPDFVLVTGDLTDAKSKNRYSSMQLESEWIIYHNVLQKSQVTKNYTWIDIRGNHDAFDVISQDAPNNYYMKYSGDKGKHSRSTLIVKKPYGSYYFIPVDGTLIPGPRRPFNFMGYLSKERLDFLHEEGQKSVGSNTTFWYGHYPSSIMTYDSLFGLRSIIGKFGSVFLNGHFHSLHGLAPIQYALQSNGFLELEVKDWMDNRYYRIVTVDHDLISFVDVPHRDWPVVLITNPKPATFMIPGREPVSRIRNSTHIRFLIFSLCPIERITVSIDNVTIDETPEHVQGPLWVTRWDPKLYLSGMHKLVVEVQDDKNRTKIAVSEFSLNDHWTTDFSWMGLILLLTDISTLAQALFVTLALASLTILVMVKLFGATRTDGVFYKLYLLSLDDITFGIILVFYFNILIGPLFVGNLLTNHIGVCFSYGLLIDGKLTREYTPYIYCLYNLLLSYLPVLYYLSNCACLRWSSSDTFRDSVAISPKNIFPNCCFLLHMFYQFHMFRNLFFSYDIIAVVVSPAYSWWFLATLFLAIRTWNLPISNRNSRQL